MFYSFAIIVLVILLLAYMYFEAGAVEVKRVMFTKNSEHLKIIHISDIHINLLRVSPKKVKEIVSKENPDLIILTGDYIERPGDIGSFLSFYDLCFKENITCLCLGNHDYKAFNGDEKLQQDFINGLKRRGANVLHNRTYWYEKNSKIYNITGIEDIKLGKPDIKKALSSLSTKAAATIAFSHNPDLALELPIGAVDYLLCGHFHGGQIWAPLNFEFRMLRNDVLCQEGITRGLHKIRGTNVYINRGLGNVIVPLRFLSRPEIAVIYIP